MNDGISSIIESAIRDSLNGIRESGPEPLLELVEFKLRRDAVEVTEQVVLNAIVSRDKTDPTWRAMHMALAQWDAVSPAPWSTGTKPWSAERRDLIYERLELSTGAREELDTKIPSASQMDAMIVDSELWNPWYTADRQRSNDFYWQAYRGVLERKGWDVDALTNLNKSTTDIVGRLSDPSAEVGYQAKGLVVGHVQSGKTANFTGIVAKAVDAGYRLVIVLTGTIELLRQQTQRRLDMELVGEENILEGVDRTDETAIRDIDYIGTQDTDWYDGKFLRHAVDIHSTPGIPAIKRLTTVGKDFRKLRLGRDALDFRRTGELREPEKPVYHADNIHSVDARIAVMKKHPKALSDLLQDLKNIRADVREIPVLIIDDEADQASVNTVNPRSKKAAADEQKKRSAINKLINELLTTLPRAQYIGYTATPFANVFISPDDSEDIFPKDFIVSLEPSAEYMGGRQFHDLSGFDPAHKGDPGVSNEAAFVRDLRADGIEDPEAERLEIRSAIDAFVLSGAIKKWREDQDSKFGYRHHTMLVHSSIRVADHSELAATFRSVWGEAGYSSPRGFARLLGLFVDDFLPVTESRSEWGHLPMPHNFDELKPYIGLAVDAITADSDPVVVVNGSKESDYSAMDFQVRPYWRIMVGGAKLSRGFTVEGLTVSYYRRRTIAADTLMQMGRWFGYRPGHNDLVRLYIGREVLDGRKKSFDLYGAFTSIVEDEEEFRDQLKKFADRTEEGKPVVRPIHVPPMVFQQLPWLRPTGANKMYNAVLQYEGTGGVVKDFNAHDYRGDGARNKKHFDAVSAWIPKLSAGVGEYFGIEGTKFEARTAILTSEEVITALGQFEMLSRDQFSPTISLIKKASEEGLIKDWAVLVPELGVSHRRIVGDITVSIMERRRRSDRPGFAGSERRHRAALEVITEKPGQTVLAGPAAEALSRPDRGALLLTFSIDPEVRKAEKSPDGSGRVDPERVKREFWPNPLTSNDVATLVSLALPYEAAPRGRIGFGVRRRDQADQAIIDTE
ncbi:Z1 domain-containing protein [Salinibacterium sp. NSLL150]|uniref:Z1 domain-containing protein n=1 Tax=unclassified Salinibacterium TaxID=2632331 RepID=UPI0018CD5471|nr:MULTISPECIES: Z1 domain-containing protein [unclassified Salinibacterium]MBH0097614.1 Z1 domain-containing protein [Salinibacterium sp. NSLL35]MBH0100369.1 Z1 domain-containing protein [Salinibacterium sp. NSLL150]MBH0103128.1 Z1 domain-containing protein [Salinibacterium sp. NSLL16]MBH0105889.1 Z1 domain-containing protein [Salinibacterium sp. NSLL17]